MTDDTVDIDDFTESMVVMFVEPEDEFMQSYGTEGHVMENEYTIALTEADAEPFLSFMEDDVGVSISLDVSGGVAMTQVIAETLEDIPPEIVTGVHRLDEVGVTRGDGYVIVSLPPEHAAYMLSLIHI